MNRDKVLVGKEVRVVYSGGKLRIQSTYIASDDLGVLVGEKTTYEDAVYIPWNSIVCIEVVAL